MHAVGEPVCDGVLDRVGVGRDGQAVLVVAEDLFQLILGLGLGASADAAEVLGWSVSDAGHHHGAAQRYFAQGLRLAPR